MYGYQPPAARRLAPPPEQYADGGLVARMKSADAGPAVFGSRGLSQLRDMVPKMAAMGFSQQAAAPTPAPAPLSDPRVAQLQAMIPQMEAMGYQKKPLTPQMLARGGMVRGPGTGTSDSIATEAEPGTYIMPADSTAAIGPDALEKMGTVPVRLSDGEFKIPPEKVMAIGEAVLKLMKDATHTPVNGEDGGQTDAEVEDDDDARGFNPADRMAQMPEQMYADGGAVGYPMQRLDIGQWAQEQEQARDDMARFNARQAIERDDQAAADAEAVAQSEEFKRRQQMPEQALANGGMVENNVTRIGNSYSGGNVGGSITVNGAAPAGTFSENPAGRMAAMPTPAATPTPSAPVGAQPATAALARPPAAPVSPVAATPAPPAPMGWAERNAQRNAEVSAASITNRPEWSRAPRQAPAGAGFQPSAERLGAQAMLEQPRRYADGGMVHRLPLPPGYKPRGYFGGDTVVDDRQQQALANQTAMYVRGAQEAAATPAPAPTPAAAPAQPAGALTRAAGAGRGFVNPASVTPAVEAMSGGLGFEPNAVTRTGNSYTGPANISGDVTINGGGPRNGGQISAQNMGAADSLARRGAAERMAEMPSAPQQVQAPMVRHSGNDWQARKDLENARTSALSITNRPEWSNTGMNRFRGGQAGPSTDVAAYNAMLSNDLALRGAQPGLDQAAMRENAENQRSSLRERGLAAQAMAAQRGEMDRTLIKEQGDNVRAGLTTRAALDAARIKAQQDNKAPAGYRWGAGGSLEAIPGGPAAAKVADDQKTKDSALDGSRQTIGTINRLLNSPGRAGATGTWNLGRFVPGTDSADFAAEVETLKAQTFLPMVQQLRGMGALSNAEGDKLNAAVGALNFNMSEKAFQESLGRIRDQFGSALQRSGMDTKDIANWGLEAPTSAADQTTRPAGASQAPAQAARIDSQQAFAALPSGARFIAPDGTTRIKP